MEKNGHREQEHIVKAKEMERDITRKNCSLGERILFTQPMNVHIKSRHDKNKWNSGDSYKVMTVMLTNQGVYLIDDFEDSF